MYHDSFMTNLLNIVSKYNWIAVLVMLILLPCPTTAEEITLRGQVFTVDVAETEKELARGLMYRKTLPEKSGMLFLYNPPRPVAMWMKNTHIPLDMVFIDAGGRIIDIAERTQPLSETPITTENDVAAVLELNAGSAQKYGMKAGDRITAAYFTDTKHE